MKKRIWHANTALAASMMGIALSGAAQAQTAGIEEIVVTAQKRSESINTVPMSITALSGEQLEQRGITDLKSLSNAIPGFIISNTYFGSPVYYLRGVGFADTAMGAKPTVTMYADEAPIPFAVMAQGTALDLERVEVLKGPQGTLFGSNSTGGAINFVAAKPTDELSAGASFTYGRFSEFDARGFISGALTPAVRGRFAISHDGMGPWQRSYTTSTTNGAKDITSGRATIETDLSEKAKLTAVLSGTIDKSDTIAPQLSGKFLSLSLIQPAFLAYPLAPNDPRAADFNLIMPDGHSLQRNDSVWQATVRADVEVSQNLNLTSLTSYASSNQSHGYDADGTTLSVTNLYLGGRLRTITQELRATGKFSEAVNYILGANYEDDKNSEYTIFDIHDGRSGHVFDSQGLPPTNAVPQIAKVHAKSYATFANFDGNLTDTFRAHAGIRYTKTDQDFSGCALAGGNLAYATGISRILGVTPPASGQCATFIANPGGGYRAGLVTNALSEDNVSWRGGLDWTPTPGTMVYATVSRGYKSGAFSNISAVFATQYVPVPQEQLTDYEAGIKADLVPGKLHVNAAAFYYDYNNKQLIGTVQVPVFVTLTALVSVPKSRVAGTEFDATFVPTPGLTLRAGGTYVSTRVTGHYNGTRVIGGVADFYGARFPDTPRWQMNASADYEWSISSSLDGFAGASLAYRSAAQGDFVFNADLVVPSYSLVDAQLGIKTTDDRWRFQVWGKNLSDKLYYTTVVKRQEAYLRTTGMPMTLGATVSFRY